MSTDPVVALLAEETNRRFEARGDDPAIDWQGQRLSFRALGQRVAAERERLRTLLPSDGRALRIGVHAPDGIANLVSGLALMFEGHTQAIVPLSATPVERRSLAGRFQLTQLLTAPERTDAAMADGPVDVLGGSSEGWQLVGLPPWTTAATRMDAEEQPGTPADGPVALLATTSGTTTGRPAVHGVTFQRLLSLLTGLDWSPYDLLDTTLLGEGLQDHSTRLFKLRCLLQGRGIVIRRLEQAVEADAFEAGCNGSPLTPYRLRDLHRRGELARWPRGFLCISGADHIPMELRRAVHGLGTVGLGITYATSQSGPLTWLPPEELLNEEESLGKPLPNVTVNPLQPMRMERGGLPFHEVVISKRMRFRRPEADGTLVEACTVLENFQPGDLLARSPTGALIFAGRSNDVFLFRSLLISPFEIEQVLSQRPEVLECLAFGAPSPSHGAVPMAAVVLRSHRDGEATALLVESLRRACQVQLGVRSPKKIVVLHDLPRGATGKPLRRVLAEAHAMKG